MANLMPELYALPPVLTTKEAAMILRCSESTVCRYVYTHELRAVYIGRERRFRLEDLMDFVDRRPATNGMEPKSAELPVNLALR